MAIGTPTLCCTRDDVGSGIGQAFSANVPAGAYIFVFIVANAAGSLNVSSIADGSNTYSRLARSGTVSANPVEIWWSPTGNARSSGSNSLTVTYSTAISGEIAWAYYVTGLTNTVDQAAGAEAVASASAPSITTTVANNITFGLQGPNGGLTVSGLSTTLKNGVGDSGVVVIGYLEYQIFAATGTEKVTWTPAGTTENACIVDVGQAAVAGGPRELLLLGVGT